MKFHVAAILALGVAPAASLSYLDSLSGAAPAVSSPAPAAEPPFFFSNGAADTPTGADNPSFFFTNAGNDGSAAPAAGSSASYLSNMSSGSTAPTGAGMTSYLDALPPNPTSASGMGGGGLPSYADTLSKSSPAPAFGMGGAGIPSYTDSLSQATAAAPVAPAAPAAPVAPAAPAAPVESVAPVAAGRSYLDAIGASASSGAPTGAGMASYLDSVPRAPTAMGGAGIQSYTASLPVTNTVAGTGAGLNTYTSLLSGGNSVSGKSYAPSGSSYKQPKAAGGSSPGKFNFAVDANAEMIESLKSAAGRKVRFTGKIN